MLDIVFEIYKNGLALGIIAAFIVMPLFLICGTARFFKRYAYAQLNEKDDLVDSSFVCRVVWCLEVFVDGKSIQEDEEIRKPVGSAWTGTALDVGLSGLFFLLLGLLWPVVIPFAIFWFPIQAMHNHHVKKKEFLKKLKEGDEA